MITAIITTSHMNLKEEVGDITGTFKIISLIFLQ